MDNLIEEQNIIKKDWRSIKLTFALIYPNIYNVGMSCYSIHLLYHLINSRDDIACERFFIPEKVKYPAQQNGNILKKRIVSLENSIFLSEFDVLGFSIQFENDYRNVLWTLEAAGIPLTSNERQKKAKNQEIVYPLIIAGGPCATSNAMVLSNYADYFVIGDVEPSLDNLLDLMVESKEKSGKLNLDLARLASIDNIFIPSINSECKRSVLKNLDDSSTPILQIKSIFKDERTKKKRKNLEFGDTFLLEVNRGCPYSCKFCISCHHNAPFRNKTFKNLVETINKATQVQEIKKITFIGSSVTSHPKFKELCEHAVDKKIDFMIPSIRIDHISKDLIEVFERGNIKTITIAPETGYEKLRYSLGKQITNTQIIETIKIIRDSKIKNIKFYFLIGLPGEWEEDVDAIIELMTEISELGFDKDSLRVNINPFIPKLNTPYQIYTDYFSKENFTDLKRKLEKIQKSLIKIPAIKLKIKNIKDLLNKAMIQAIFSLGDKEVSKILLDYYNMGATYGALKKAAKNSGFSFDEYFERIKEGYKPLPPSCSI